MKGSLIFLMSVVLMLSSCCKEKNCAEALMFDGKYFEGEIFRPAAVQNPNGLIRIHVNEGDDEEKKLWLIPYQTKKFDLERFTKVYFKVNRHAGIYYAVEITSTKPEFKQMQNIYDLPYAFINYHIGHPEYGQHRKLHVIGPKTIIEGTPLVSMNTYQVNKMGDRMTENKIKYFYKSELEVLDLDTFYYSTVVDKIGQYEVSRLTFHHVH